MAAEAEAAEAADGDGDLAGPAMESPLLVDNSAAARGVLGARGARGRRESAAVVVAGLGAPTSPASRALLALRRNSQPAPSSGRFGKQ